MFLELIATVAAGLAGAGAVMLLNRVLRGRLPRWLAPVLAGAAMIGTTVSMEYGWYANTRAGLPEGIEVIQTVDARAPWQPWTYVVPYVERFAALDRGSVKRNPALPDQRLAEIYFFGRWAPINRMPVIVDCAAQRRAELSDGATFDAQGTVTDARWVKVGAEDPVLRAVCEVA